MINIEKIRQETPGVTNVIHFNNAGASLISEPVHKAVTGYLEEELHKGGYETAADRNIEILDFYQQAAHLINSTPGEIAFMENATVAWDMAFFSIPFEKGDIILTSTVEYASNFIAYLQLKKRFDIDIQVIPDTETGEVDVEALDNMISPKVKLISITHVPTNGGLVNPAEEIGVIAQRHGILYLLDACQSAGQYPLDVKKIGCDMLSATGRKYLRGPRGTGFLYFRKEAMENIEPYSLDLHSAVWTSIDSYKTRSDARKFEKWETNLANKVGLRTAMAYALEIGMEAIWQRVQELGATLRSKLSTIKGVTVRDIGKVKGGIVTFTVNDWEPSVIRDELRNKNINVSMPDYNGTLIDMNKRGLDTMVRSSVHYYNTEKEIDTFCEALEELITQK